MPLPLLILVVLAGYFALVLACGSLLGHAIRRLDREPIPVRLHDRDPYERRS